MNVDNSLKILRGDSFYVSEFLSLKQPKIGEIAEYGDIQYYNMISTLCATPTDLMVFLEDTVGVAYETCPELVLFAIIIKSMPIETTKIIFGDLDLSRFSISIDETGKTILKNPEGYIISDPMYQYIMTILRKMHGLKKNVKIPGNAAAKKYILLQARRAQERNKRRTNKEDGILLPIICSLVNCNGFKYNYETVFHLTLFQLNASLRSIQKEKEYEHIMHGVYSGTIDCKKISKDELSWILKKNE